MRGSSEKQHDHPIDSFNKAQGEGWMWVWAIKGLLETERKRRRKKGKEMGEKEGIREEMLLASLEGTATTQKEGKERSREG